jgi:hypothetical protein
MTAKGGTEIVLVLPTIHSAAFGMGSGVATVDGGRVTAAGATSGTNSSYHFNVISRIFSEPFLNESAPFWSFFFSLGLFGLWHSSSSFPVFSGSSAPLSQELYMVILASKINMNKCFFLVFFHLPSVGSYYQLRDGFFYYHKVTRVCFFSHNYKKTANRVRVFSPPVNNKRTSTQLFTVYSVCVTA